MKANSTHISLETAKLLKDCKVESEYFYYQDELIHNELFYKIYNEHKELGIYGIELQEKMKNICYSAYTWQEILWEYPILFFGNEEGSEYYKSINILQKLQDKEYDKADKYFRDNCILIK